MGKAIVHFPPAQQNLVTFRLASKKDFVCLTRLPFQNSMWRRLCGKTARSHCFRPHRSVAGPARKAVSATSWASKGWKSTSMSRQSSPRAEASRGSGTETEASVEFTNHQFAATILHLRIGENFCCPCSIQRTAEQCLKTPARPDLG